jgi:hypothetical protein
MSATTTPSGGVLAIDPGTTMSAWVLLRGREIADRGIDPNADLLEMLRGTLASGCVVVIEKVASYGMAVGAEVFETVFWSGRFAEAARPAILYRPTRKAIVTHLCGSARAKDPNVRQALIDRFGGSEATRKGGPLHGIVKDLWAALAVGVAYQEGVR